MHNRIGLINHQVAIGVAFMVGKITNHIAGHAFYIMSGDYYLPTKCASLLYKPLVHIIQFSHYITLHYITLIFIMRFSQKAQSAYNYKMLLRYTYNKIVTLKLTIETMIAE